MKFKSILTACVLSVGLFMATALPAQAAVPLKETFAAGGTAVGSTLAYFVVPVGDGRPAVTYLSATSDKAGSVLQFSKAESGAHMLTIATNASQAIVYLADNTKYAANDVVVIRHSADDTYERRIVSSASTTGQITLTANLTSAIVAGDQLWKMTSYGKIPVGAATKEITGGTSAAIYNAPSGRPVLIDLDGTSAETINLVTGVYLKTGFIQTQ